MNLRQQVGPLWTFVRSLLGLSAISTVLFVVGAIASRSLENWYLLWNLFLAWLPLLISYGLIQTLRHKLWSSWPAILLTLLWLLLLPNSFYMVSDFIHLQDTPHVNLLYDAVLFTMFIITGLALGYLSLYAMHMRLRQRVPIMRANLFVAAILLLCSFAMYLGRDLRWNSWDVLVNPAGILFDVSERVIHPFTFSDTYSVTLVFFIFLASLYWMVWSMVRSLLELGKKP